MHNLINEEHGHDSVLANYVEQIKKKDKLLMERDVKLQELADQNGLLENEKQALLKQLQQKDRTTSRASMARSGMSRPGSTAGVNIGDTVDPEAAEHMKKLQDQNDELKKQIEAMAHTQAKLAAKHQRYRDERKKMIETGMDGDAKSRNDSFQGSVESLKQIMSDPVKAQQALQEMAESEEEDKDVVANIEGAQKAVIEAERAEKNQLRRTVTKMG